MKNLISDIRKAKHSVEGLSRAKQGRELAKKHHGYDVKPSEHEKKLQSKSVSKEKIKKGMR